MDRSPKSVLEIGCGPGLLTKALMSKAALWVASDYVPRFVARVRGTPRLCADMRRLPFRDGAFDRILVSSVLQYIARDEIGPALRELRRVVKIGGRAFVSGNPDESKLPWFIVKRKTARASIKKSLMATWTLPEELLAFARHTGWKAEIRRINPSVWQSGYMFDLLLVAA